MLASLLIFYFQHSNKDFSFKMSQVIFWSKYFPTHTEKIWSLYSAPQTTHDLSLSSLTLSLTILPFYHSILLTPGDFMFLEHIKHTPPWESGTAWVMCSSPTCPGHFSVLQVFVELSPHSWSYLKFQSTAQHLCLNFPTSCSADLLTHNIVTLPLVSPYWLVTLMKEYIWKSFTRHFTAVFQGARCSGP